MYHLLYKMKMYTLSNLDPHLSNHALDIYVLPHISDTWPSMGLESSFYEKMCFATASRSRYGHCGWVLKL